MSVHADLFALAAKVGSLEGYLYERKKVDPAAYDDWVGNIARMSADLPVEVLREVRPQFHRVLTQVGESSRNIPGLLPKSLETLATLIRELAGDQ